MQRKIIAIEREPLIVAIPLRGYVVCNIHQTGPGGPLVGCGGRNPLTGLCGLQLTSSWPRSTPTASCRNPLTGLCGLQQNETSPRTLSLAYTSQSPYGAMWSATGRCACGTGPRPRSRNPLTGLSGLQPTTKCLKRGLNQRSRNPLTGLSGLQPPTDTVLEDIQLHLSQSPYGAKRFATLPP